MAQPPPAPPPPPRKWKWHDYNPTTKDQTSDWWKHYCESINKPSFFDKVTTYGRAPLPDAYYYPPPQEGEVHWELFRYVEGVPQLVHGASGLPRSRL